MMEDLYFHIIDIAHGAVMAVLVYFIVRLLVFRKEGAVRVRWLAVGLMVLAVLQTLDLFEEGSPLQTPVYELISIVMDGCAMLLSLLILWLLYRSRHIYPKHVVRYGSGILIAIIVCYLFCALLRFEEWTYPVYLIVSTIGWTLFCLTIERIPNTPAVPQQQPSENKDQYEDFRRQLDDVMRHNNLFCNEELTREDVCRAMCTNRTTFAQNLKLAYGKTFSEYLRDLRLEEAARLLRETDMPIDQVAFSVGLKSVSGFHRNFLLTYGMTPASYRRNYAHKTILT